MRLKMTENEKNKESAAYNLDPVYKLTESILKLTIGSTGVAFGFTLFSDKFTPALALNALYGIIIMIAATMMSLIIMFLIAFENFKTEDKAQMYIFEFAVMSTIILYITALVHFVSSVSSADATLLSFLIGSVILLTLGFTFGTFVGIPFLIKKITKSKSNEK